MRHCVLLLIFVHMTLRCVSEELDHCYRDGQSAGYRKGADCTPVFNLGEDCEKQFKTGCNEAKLTLHCLMGKEVALSQNSCKRPIDVRDEASNAEFKCCSACEIGIELGKTGSCDRYIGKYEEVLNECCTQAGLDRRTRSTVAYDVYPESTISNCSFSHRCEYNCFEKDGTSYCSCPPGYVLSNDDRTCTDVNECSMEPFPCEAGKECFNLNGTFDCRNSQEPEAASSLVHERCHGSHCSSEESSRDYHYPTSRYARSGHANPNSDRMVRNNMENQSICKRGFKFDEKEKKCVDIDECLLESTLCKNNSVCINTQGSYTCTCAARFHSDSSGHCIEAKCLEGYAFNLTSNECGDINECEHNPCSEREKCINSIGSFKCVNSTCLLGYEVTDNGCKDIDECAKNLHNCTGERMKCENTYGSFKCDCIQGFEMGANNTCVDVDECDLYNPCSFSQTCENTFGNFTCECEKGFEVAGERCVDIDECKSEGICGNLECQNTHGSYECLCDLAGHELINNTCVDVNECENGWSDPCGHQECRNTKGSYECVDCPTHSSKRNRECTCIDGYRMNNGTCVDIDECAENNKICGNQICGNTPGRYDCFTCPNGTTYKGQECVDIDECKEKTTCRESQMCTNLLGSYHCTNTTCDEGYESDPVDPRLCRQIRKRYNYQKPAAVSVKALALPNHMNIDGTGITLYTMLAPPSVNCKYNMEFMRASGNEPSEPNDWQLISGNNLAQVRLYRQLRGPQQVELLVDCNFRSRTLHRTKLFVFVSEL